MRGATAAAEVSDEIINISIHAPHAGCDMSPTMDVERDGLFQSTHPMRGATGETNREGLPLRVISIHAPHAGCDDSTPLHITASYDFNPRTPCGVRPSKPSWNN